MQKTQEGIKEAGQIMDEQKTQLQKREEEAERLKDEVVGVNVYIKWLQTQQKTYDKFRKSNAVLDEILNYQRSPFIKTGLGYENNHKTLEKKTEINENVLESPNCSKDNNMK